MNKRQIAVDFAYTSEDEKFLIGEIEHCLQKIADEGAPTLDRYVGLIFVKGYCEDYLIERGAIPESVE